MCFAPLRTARKASTSLDAKLCEVKFGSVNASIAMAEHIGSDRKFWGCGILPLYPPRRWIVAEVEIAS